MRVCTFIFAFAIALVTAEVGHANDYELSIGSGAHFVPMKSVDSISEDRGFGVASFGVGMTVPQLSILSGFSSEIALNYNLGSLSGMTFGRIESKLAVDTVMLTARLRRRLFSSGSAFVEAGLGWKWASLELRDVGTTNQRTIEGSSQALAAAVSVGMDFRLLGSPRHRFSLSIRGTVGYEASTSLRMDATSASGAELALTTRGSDLGSVNTSGVTMRWGLIGGF